MEKYFPPARMQTITCINALKNDDDDGFNLCKRRYPYSPSCDDLELDSCSPRQPAVPGSRPGLRMRASKPDSPPLVKASCNLSSDAEAPSSMNGSPEVADSSWMLKTLHRVTFSSRDSDSWTSLGCDTAGDRYPYAPPTGICGFVDGGFTRIHPKRRQSEVTVLQNEELCKDLFNLLKLRRSHVCF